MKIEITGDNKQFNIKRKIKDLILNGKTVYPMPLNGTEYTKIDDVARYTKEDNNPVRLFERGSTEFKSKYIKVWRTDKDDFLDVGVKDNIESQWNERSKAFGMASSRAYLFGYTTDFGVDHSYIIDEMTKMLGEPRMMFSVDESNSKVSLYIHPAHRGMTPDTAFEKKIVENILSEAKETFEKIPEGKRFQIDIEYEFLDKEEAELTRAKSIEELDIMISHLKR